MTEVPIKKKKCSLSCLVQTARKIKAVNNDEAFKNISITLRTLITHLISGMLCIYVVYVLLLLHWHLSASTYHVSWRLSLTYTADHSKSICLSRGVIPNPQVTVMEGAAGLGQVVMLVFVMQRNESKRGKIQNRAHVLLH